MCGTTNLIIYIFDKIKLVMDLKNCLSNPKYVK